MAFDACGTTKLEGEEIIKRLAEYLGIDKGELTQALIYLVQKNNALDRDAYIDLYGHEE